MQEEAARYGSVEQVAVPPPTPAVQDLMPGRCYVKYATSQDAEKGEPRRGAGQAVWTLHPCAAVPPLCRRPASPRPALPRRQGRV